MSPKSCREEWYAYKSGDVDCRESRKGEGTAVAGQQDGMVLVEVYRDVLRPSVIL